MADDKKTQTSSQTNNPKPGQEGATLIPQTPTTETTPQVDDSKKPTKTNPAAFALSKINGTIEPRTMFTPESKEQREELLALGAIRDLTEDEETLYEKVLNSSDVLG